MRTTLNVLIVDDARLARQELRTLLAALPWVQCVGEADDVPAAREAIARLKPDLVLLDVQMPSGTGFDVLDGLDPAAAVVFVTAYDAYAVRAFQTMRWITWSSRWKRRACMKRWNAHAGKTCLRRRRCLHVAA